MNTFSQWAHQHDLLLVCAAVIAGAGLLLVFLRPRWRWWFGWLGAAASCGVAAVALRTPAASLYEHPDPLAPTFALADEGTLMVEFVGYSEPDLGSIEAIEQAIAGGTKPTLVEIYADFGLS
jgi:hypothetical protein